MKRVKGKAVRVVPHAKFNAKIRSVVTVGKEELTLAEATRASLVLDAFEGSDSLLSSPFVRKIFFPNYPLHKLKWPELPGTWPEIDFTYRELNESQRKAVEKSLSNKEEDRHVVIVVSSIPSFYFPLSRWVSGAARDRQNHCNCRCCSEHGQRAQIKYSLGHCTIKRRDQERSGEICRIRLLGLQAPRLNGVLLRLVSLSDQKTLVR